MAITADILDAFCAHIGATAQTLSLPVAYPGVAFKPPAAGGWIEVAAHWNGNEPYGLPNSGPSIELGFFRVLVCWRLGSGPMAAQSAAESVIAAIPKGSTFGPALTERAPSLSGAMADPDRIILPITVRWRATR